MVNKVFIDGDGLIQIWVVGDQTAADTREMGDKLGFCTRKLRSEGHPVLILDNLVRMGRTDAEVRKEVARIAGELDYDRGAMVGDGSWPMRFGTNLMLHAIGRHNLRYFGHEESARKWLMELAVPRPK